MNTLQEATHWIKNSITIKMATIGFLALVLLIPASMVQDIIKERSQSHNEVVKEVTGKWGTSQIIAGPILTIPYKIIEIENGKTTERITHAHFLPEKLIISGIINPEIRNRSIYKVILYNANIKVSGNFDKPNLEALNIPSENVQWEEAFITVGITDLRGIRRTVEIDWDGKKLQGNPGVLDKKIVNSGINTKVALQPDSGSSQFSFAIDLNGSENISFVPFGKETHVTMESKWNSPGFQGAFLPEKREVTKDGFNAEWNVLQLNRNYPQQWTNLDDHEVTESAFGVDLIFPIDHYQKSTRSSKYAVMFIFLTFLAFFVNEVINKARIHPVQYLLIGLSLIIFYTLLVSLSEYIGFNWAYLSASMATIALIAGYAMSITKRKVGIIIGLILVLLYGFLFVLLQLEDYSLMFGSIGLFVILGGIMVASRKVDWYAPLNKKKE